MNIFHFMKSFESIELVQGENRKVPMIMTKDKSYSLINIVDIQIIENRTPTIKDILQKALTLKIDDSNELTMVAESIIEHLDDKVWARDVYEKAISNCDNTYNGCYTAKSIFEKFQDKELANKAIVKSYDIKEDNTEFAELIKTSKEIEFSSKTIAKWVDEYVKACKTSEDYLYLAQISEQDRTFALNKALDRAEHIYDCLEIIEKIK